MKKIVVDSSGLLLFAIGNADSRYLLSHKRVREYGNEGFRQFAKLLAKYDQLLVTPHSLTEAWNLAVNDRAIDEMSRRIRLQLAGLVNLAVEIYTPSRSLSENNEFLRLGFADAGQLVAAESHSCPLITADKGLYLAALKRNISVINLREIQPK